MAAASMSGEKAKKAKRSARREAYTLHWPPRDIGLPMFHADRVCDQ